MALNKLIFHNIRYSFIFIFSRCKKLLLLSKNCRRKYNPGAKKREKSIKKKKKSMGEEKKGKKNIKTRGENTFGNILSSAHKS
jgi:hypothetical protein